MHDRTTITNLLMLTILAGILLISGSLQCAFDCLTLDNHSHAAALRVDGCHMELQQPEQFDQCPNKACHEWSPSSRNLGRPHIYSLHSTSQPLSSVSRQLEPDFRAGEPLHLEPLEPPRYLALSTLEGRPPTEQIRSLRTTVLLN